MSIGLNLSMKILGIDAIIIIGWSLLLVLMCGTNNPVSKILFLGEETYDREEINLDMTIGNKGIMK